MITKIPADNREKIFNSPVLIRIYSSNILDAKFHRILVLYAIQNTNKINKKCNTGLHKREIFTRLESITV